MSAFERPAAWLGLCLLGGLASVPPSPGPAQEAVASALEGRLDGPKMSPLRWEVELGERRLTGRGSVVVDTDGRLAMSLYDPLGVAPVARLRSDGAAVAITVAGGRRHWVAHEADAVLDSVSAHGLADLVGLGLGRLRLDPESLVEVRRTGSGWWTRWLWMGRAIVVELDHDGQPRRARVMDDDGLPAIGVTWTPDALQVRAVDVGVGMRLSGLDWSPIVVDPDMFQLGAPDGFRALPLEDAWLEGDMGWLAGLLAQ